jgi:hypothetical protein
LIIKLNKAYFAYNLKWLPTNEILYGLKNVLAGYIRSKGKSTLLGAITPTFLLQP